MPDPNECTGEFIDGACCRAILLAEADVLDSAARIAEGDLQPIRRMLPSWRWTQAQPSPGEASEPDKPQQESP